MAATILIICRNCEEEFRVPEWILKRGVKYCSRDCYNAHKLKRNLPYDQIGSRMER